MTALDTRPDTTDRTGDGDDHYICSDCWPDFVPGRMVVSFCGLAVHDSDLPYDGDETGICPLCVLVAHQPIPCRRHG